jgi:hypothetical protein
MNPISISIGKMLTVMSDQVTLSEQEFWNEIIMTNIYMICIMPYLEV